MRDKRLELPVSDHTPIQHHQSDSWQRDKNLTNRIGRALTAINQASRRQFDAPLPLIGEAQVTFERMSADLTRATAEVVRLRAQITAMEASTSWRLTRPIRLVVNRMRPTPDTAQPQPITASATSESSVVSADRPMLKRLRPQEPAPELALIEARPESSPAELIAAALATGSSHVCFHDPRDALEPDAVQCIAAAVAQAPELDVIFADEDWLDGEGRRTRPFLKPGWSLELQRGRDLLGPFTFLRTSLVAAANPITSPAWRYDLANQVIAASRPERIHHVPAILCHRTVAPDGAALRDAAEAELARHCVAGFVEPLESLASCHRVVYQLGTSPPLVSVIVPTRDRTDLLRVCTKMVLQQTDYSAIELIIVDNGSVEPSAVALIEELATDSRVHVLRDDRSFNWSALCNAGIANSSGDVIVLLNNDVALSRSDWLTVLISHVVQPNVGAVGAKLLYPDGTLQHAGLTTDERGIGRHLLRYAPGNGAGPFDLLAVARDVWGVTGACMAFRREVFLAVGGLNEGLPVTCNDVDLCLRMSSAGYRIVWTPWSVVEHRELASRPPDQMRKIEAEAERLRLQRDWGCLLQYDPYLHPSLRLVGDDLQWHSSDYLEFQSNAMLPNN